MAFPFFGKKQSKPAGSVLQGEQPSGVQQSGQSASQAQQPGQAQQLGQGIQAGNMPEPPQAPVPPGLTASSREDKVVITRQENASSSSGLASNLAASRPQIKMPADSPETVAEPAVSEPAVSEPTVSEPAVFEPTVSEPAVFEPAVTEPTASESTVAEPTVAEPAETGNKPTGMKPDSQEKTAETGAPSGLGLAQAEDQLKTELRTDSFYIDLRPKVVKLPPYEQKKTINVRYPLIPPFAFAHIYWDKTENELLYTVEEPMLDKTETELLELIQLGLEEMINISFVRAAKSNVLLQYLERNVQSILIELGTKVSKKTYQKLMYYIYRNSVGLNQIEPLLNDYYVEDIECNGINFPLYIVHRKYQNLKTNIIFKNASGMTDFVEKLAQKTGRYISYAKPLLDGTLPDGSRVNATYTEDITTRGPTFTIRKFTKEPWTPVHLIQSKTASPESFAYMWMAIENKFNVMVVGETASGKTTYLNCIVDFIPPEARICSIEDTRELNLAHINWLPSVTRAGFGMPTILGTQYGEITLFDLLRESFRQNPDYVIVGEIRGKEAYVLFQGMASGHPSFSTFHAASVETVVKRLETPPINLSPSLVESLDIVCICIHVKDQKKNMRRLKEIDEIEEISQDLGKAKYRVALTWDPLKDKHQFNKDSAIFKKITSRTGMNENEVFEEFKKRAELLRILAEKNVVNFIDFNRVVNDYYKDPETVLKKYGVKI